MRKVTRRRFLKLALAGVVEAGALTCGGWGYATAVEPNWLALERVDVPLHGLPTALEGFTIVQLSDLHRGPEVAQEDIERAVGLALRQEADLAVLTGDFVSRSADNAASCAEALAPLVDTGEVLACLGNHDHWTHADTVAGALAGVGIAVLRNAACEVADGLWVAGVDDVWERHADLGEALAGVPSGAAVVLLAHEPDYADVVASDGRVGLQISGHSHGGQVRWPFFGPPVLPYLATKYYAGRYRVGDMWLYVNRGVGLISPAVRFNCRPEVTLLTLREGGV
ncbi:MAG: metallophosphoesterase [Anaerolineae bacterium]|nr:metallophosphoesterase [Anaerolineae bacterium]